MTFSVNRRMLHSVNKPLIWGLLAASLFTTGCYNKDHLRNPHESEAKEQKILPLISHIYTGDPAAHVFNNRIYIYPSHDVDTGVVHNDEGGQFDMRDYHVFSMAAPGAELVDHGVALRLEDIPWASRQLWAPDAAEKNGTYYLYFPAKDSLGIFRIGVASSESPSGPFTALPTPILGTYSNDPTVFRDDDGSHYLLLGGIGGGQLQRWTQGFYQAVDDYPTDNEPAIAPRMARLNEDMVSLAEPLREISLTDETGKPLTAGDRDRRFFEGAWMHKHNGKYYLSWSTGDTHRIVYAVGDRPYGPFTYKGVILEPVLGWTSQHSIVKFEDQWYLFFHDAELSGGQTHLRNVKMTRLSVSGDGSIQTVSHRVTP